MPIILVRALLLLLLAACWPLAPETGGAETLQQARAQMIKRLSHLTGRYEDLFAESRAAQEELRILDQRLAQARQESVRLRKHKATLTNLMAAARIDLPWLTNQLARKQNQRRRRLRALYLYGPDATMWLLASSQDFEDALSRSRVFTQILASDLKAIKKLKRHRSQLVSLQSKLVQHRKDLDRLRDHLSQQESRLAALKHARHKTLRNAGRKLDQLNRSIAALREAQTRLARTLALTASPGDLSPAKPEPSPLGTMAKPHSALPVRGKLAPTSGGQRGVTLASVPLAPVRAPWGGRVIFAGFLQGYGKVLVLDHGKRIHTVLANLGELRVAKGVRVKGGQVVGALDKAGRLYLEVRRGTKPVDPMEVLGLPPGGYR